MQMQEGIKLIFATASDNFVYFALKWIGGELQPG